MVPRQCFHALKPKARRRRCAYCKIERKIRINTSGHCIARRACKVGSNSCFLPPSLRLQILVVFYRSSNLGLLLCFPVDRHNIISQELKVPSKTETCPRSTWASAAPLPGEHPAAEATEFTKTSVFDTRSGPKIKFKLSL